MLEFTIVAKADPKQFIKVVNKLMGEGWTLQGGTAFSGETAETNQVFCQAMVREVLDENQNEIPHGSVD